MNKEKSFKLFSLAVKKVFNIKIKQDDINEFTAKELSKLNELLEGELSLKFGIAGKAGSGKTTTLNALFDLNEKVGHVEAGTDKVMEYKRNLGPGKGNIIFYDFPGLRDSIKADKKVQRQYDEFIPICDVILWVISSRDRSLQFDEEYIKDLPSKMKNKIVVGISQVDIMYPENWNRGKKLPSVEQYNQIQRKRKDLQKRFNIELDKIVEYCAFYEERKLPSGKKKKDDRRFNLFHLVKVLLENCGKDSQFVLGQSFSEKIFQTVFGK